VIWLATLLAVAAADELLPPITGPRAQGASWFARLADAVAVLQLASFALFLWRVSALDTLERAVAVVLLGIGGAFSSMVAAHELIHRPRGLARWTGRALLWTVLYDHFFTDHLRGHHRTAGTAEDVLTARTHEPFFQYLRRSWVAEIRSAWRIEVRRSAGRGPIHAWLANEVVRGFAIEVVLLGSVALVLAPEIAALVVAQAALAHLVTGAVNFFQHWGIARSHRKLGAGDAWESGAPLSHYALLGLSFHADHHVRASRPFDQLQPRQESPRLPHGYFMMVAMVLLRSGKTRRLLQAELARVQGA
jgi:alkane 1-monooxygenase